MAPVKLMELFTHNTVLLGVMPAVGLLRTVTVSEYEKGEPAHSAVMVTVMVTLPVKPQSIVGFALVGLLINARVGLLLVQLYVAPDGSVPSTIAVAVEDVPEHATVGEYTMSITPVGHWAWTGDASNKTLNAKNTRTTCNEGREQRGEN